METINENKGLQVPMMLAETLIQRTVLLLEKAQIHAIISYSIATLPYHQHLKCEKIEMKMKSGEIIRLQIVS